MNRSGHVLVERAVRVNSCGGINGPGAQISIKHRIGDFQFKEEKGEIMDKHERGENMDSHHGVASATAFEDTASDKAFIPTNAHSQAKVEALFIELVEHVVKQEWEQFQDVHNDGGRAVCQGNWPVFHQMRASQFLTWNYPLLRSYSQDLDYAEGVGRNLLSEKYGRMMESTAPEQFSESIAPYLASLSEERVAQQESIIRQQVTWVIEFRRNYPKLGQAMRLIHTSEDSRYATSFETYLRGELSTYSARTLDCYETLIEQYRREGLNLTQETIDKTVRLGGFENLSEAEGAQ